MNRSLWAVGVAVLMASPAVAERPHLIEINQRILTRDDGLVLGNGDLSVSVYQTADRIVWRLGKGDVWDRRHDRSDDPRPLSIEEFAHGIRDEGWKAPHNNFIEPTKGTDQPERVKEVSLTPPSYQRRPYPCPKPVGELILQLPPSVNVAKMSIRQRLVIEQGRLDIECSWPSGQRLTVETFITPRDNALVVHWEVKECPVWFSIHRWPDPTVHEYAARHVADTRNRVYRDMYHDPKVTPLAPPTVGSSTYDGVDSSFIQQTFPPDPLFPEGFRYRMVPFVSTGTIEVVDLTPLKEARLNLLPAETITTREARSSKYPVTQSRLGTTSSGRGRCAGWRT